MFGGKGRERESGGGRMKGETKGRERNEKGKTHRNCYE